MKSRYVADEQSIIQTQGLRVVEKVDRTYSNSGLAERTSYFIELEYKGLSKRIEYKKVEVRDKTFAELSEILKDE